MSASVLSRYIMPTTPSTKVLCRDHSLPPASTSSTSVRQSPATTTNDNGRAWTSAMIEDEFIP